MNTAASQIIVTRPSPSGEALCVELEANNFFSLHCPLISFEADTNYSESIGFETLQRTSVWIFISRQAVDYCFQPFNDDTTQRLHQLRHKKHIIAVGDATADSLQQLGFEPRVPNTPDSEGIIELIEHDGLTQDTTVLIRGNKGRGLLEDYFRNEQLTSMPVYKRNETNNTFPALSKNTTYQNTAIVVTSGQLLQLVTQQISAHSKTSVTIIAGSQRISEMAQHIGFTNCYTAKNASNSELLKSCILWRNDVS